MTAAASGPGCLLNVTPPQPRIQWMEVQEGKTESVLGIGGFSAPMPGTSLVLQCWMHSKHFRRSSGPLGKRKVS